MKQIRICIDPDVIYDLAMNRPSTDWVDDTPEERSAFEILIQAGNALYGKNTHWLEEREV